MFNKPHPPIFYSGLYLMIIQFKPNIFVFSIATFPLGLLANANALVIRLTQLTFIISLLLSSNSYNMSKP